MKESTRDAGPGAGNGKTEARSLYRGGLGRTLLLSFLLISLVPLTIVSAISYRNAQRSLQAEAKDFLSLAMRAETAQIVGSLSDILVNLRLQSGLRSTITLLENLVYARETSGLTVGEFVKTFDWATMSREDGAHLTKIQQTYEYEDIFLVDTEGNVLFSATEEVLPGANIFAGEHAESELGKVCRRSLATKAPVSSDLHLYGPSDDKVSIFVAQSIEDDETGEKIGVIVFEIPGKRIIGEPLSSPDQTESGKTYLVGSDLLMRSASRFEEDVVLKRMVDTAATRAWLKTKTGQHPRSEAGEQKVWGRGATEANIYPDYRGISVLGEWHNLAIMEELGQRWVVVAEFDKAEAFRPARVLGRVVLVLLLATGAVVLALAVMLTRRIVLPIRELTNWARRVSRGDLNYTEIRTPANEIGVLNDSFREAVASLRANREETRTEVWLKTGLARLNDTMSGDQDIIELSGKVISELTTYLDAQVGALYVLDGERGGKRGRSGTAFLTLTGSYAYTKRKNLSNKFRLGEGLVGQAALDKQRIFARNVPEDYKQITSTLLEGVPRFVCVSPFLSDGRVKGVIEIGSMHEITDQQLDYLDQALAAIAVNVQVAQSRTQVAAALTESQALSEELQSQQEELKSSNEELEEKTRMLMESEETLKAQQEELQVTNEELESFAYSVSHDLRAPLRHMSGFAKMFMDHAGEGLDDKGRRYLDVVTTSAELMGVLIDDLLQFSRTGRAELRMSQFNMGPLVKEAINELQPEIEGRNIEWKIGALPKLRADRAMMLLVLVNLISNAIKFTSPREKALIEISTGGDGEDETVFFVRDNGVGFDMKYVDKLFGVFQRLHRKEDFEGTGIGLANVRRIISRHGGRSWAEAEVDKGATIWFSLPK